jgi:hypothetical protein
MRFFELLGVIFGVVARRRVPDVARRPHGDGLPRNGSRPETPHSQTSADAGYEYALPFSHYAGRVDPVDDLLRDEALIAGVKHGTASNQ